MQLKEWAFLGNYEFFNGKIKDEKFPVNVDDEMLLKLSEKQYPTIKEGVFEKMEEAILKAKENLDSVGGKIECVALHVPAGVGEPFFDSLESHLSSLMFSIPAVKSVSFGDGETRNPFNQGRGIFFFFAADNQLLRLFAFAGGERSGIVIGE